jgi:hypothetical protein
MANRLHLQGGPMKDPALMEAAPPRLTALVEWLAAAVCVAGAVLVLGGASHGFRGVRPVEPVIAGAAPSPIIPAGLRPGSIAVPLVVLPDGKQLSVGSPVASLERLGPLAQDGPTVTEKAGAETTEARTYRYAGLQFVVVVEGQRIAAIYR